MILFFRSFLLYNEETKDKIDLTFEWIACNCTMFHVEIRF